MKNGIASQRLTRQAEELLRSELGELGETLASDIGRQAEEAKEVADIGRKIAITGIVAYRFACLVVYMSKRPRRLMMRGDLCRAVGLNKNSIRSIVPYVKASIAKGQGLFEQTKEKSGGKRVGVRFRLSNPIVELLAEQPASHEPRPRENRDRSVTHIEQEADYDKVDGVVEVDQASLKTLLRTVSLNSPLVVRITK